MLNPEEVFRRQGGKEDKSKREGGYKQKDDKGKEEQARGKICTLSSRRVACRGVLEQAEPYVQGANLPTTQTIPLTRPDPKRFGVVFWLCRACKPYGLLQSPKIRAWN